MKANGVMQRAKILKYLQTGNYDKHQIAKALKFPLSETQSRLKELSFRRQVFSMRVKPETMRGAGSRTIYTLEKPDGFISYSPEAVNFTYEQPFEDVKLCRMLGYSSAGNDKPTRRYDCDNFQRDYDLHPSQKAYATSYYANQTSFPPTLPL